MYLILRKFATQAIEIIDAIETFDEGIAKMNKIKEKHSSDKSHQIAISSTNKTKWWLIQVLVLTEFHGSEL